MDSSLKLYNSLTRSVEPFIPLVPGKAGMYVCGPTVYSNAHMGHARAYITFDLLYRYLLHLGYQVRYVRNITDVGHLEDEVEGAGEDRIAKKARLEQLEPMEVVQKYMNTFHRNMDDLNTLPPGIEPRASGHIIEQQVMIRRLMEKGYAYEVNGSVYFDVVKYDRDFRYGILSGRNLDEMMSNTRQLEGQQEKKNPYDFALWKKAAPEHIMRWPSEWSEGFPGWHLECSAMSTKYLGEVFDIHGGGMDLQFPHHECEIAQSTAAMGHPSVRFWVHNNMITINGQKMARSLGNFITLDELFSGNHPLLTQAYSPMTIRFFILQAHYRSTLDFSNEALQAAGKGLEKLMKAISLLDKLKTSGTSSADISLLESNCKEAINDDLNSPILIAHLFDGVRIINSVYDSSLTLTTEDLDKLRKLFNTYVFDILGLKNETSGAALPELISGLVELALQIRTNARNNKDWGTSDFIRNELARIGIVVKDRKDGFEWEVKND
jgi:cysteinyl-tRNA synthetase